jgi:cytochrome c
LKFLRLAWLAVSLAPSAGFAAPDDGRQAQALTNERGCVACHAMVRKRVGPGFGEIAARYRNDPSAPARIAGKIQSGSVGTWGRTIMPRQPGVTDAEAKVLAGWILSQPSPP